VSVGIVGAGAVEREAGGVGAGIVVMEDGDGLVRARVGDGSMVGSDGDAVDVSSGHGDEAGAGRRAAQLSPAVASPGDEATVEVNGDAVPDSGSDGAEAGAGRRVPDL